MTPTPPPAGYIRPEIAHLAVPLGEVTPYPGNPRQGNPNKIRASLAEHGQYAPLLVQASSGYVVKGNNTWHVMREDGWTEAAVLRLEIDDERARAILLIDNASSDDSDYDKNALAQLLAGVVDWDATGWTPDQFDDLLAELGDADAELAGLGPQVLPEVPATDAGYAETPDAEAARQAKFDTWKPHYTRGLAEMIILLPDADKAEATTLVADIRGRLGEELTAGEVVLRGLRLLAAVSLAADEPADLVTVGALLRAAGHITDTDPAPDTPAAPDPAPQEVTA